jgi:hypothetical protein
MDSVTTPPIDAVPRTKQAAVNRQIRGSSLLLIGRTLSMAVNFAVQVLIVRYLSKTDYGAFAYALSIVARSRGLYRSTTSAASTTSCSARSSWSWARSCRSGWRWLCSSMRSKG